MNVELNDHQLDAISMMKNGCILCGGVGSGKSRTALAYYYIRQHGKLFPKIMPMIEPKDLYVITTAKKRDTGDWEEEMSHFRIYPSKDRDEYDMRVVVDSWNNIQKYKDIFGAFFIFDEQRAISTGAWGRAFIRIAKRNDWIMLSATPGDNWMDYLPVFMAHGYFHSKWEFMQDHVVLKPFRNYTDIDHYIGEGKLLRLRRDILVDLDATRHTKRHDEAVWVNYNKDLYKKIARERYDPWKDEPITSASGLCYCLRRVANSDESRYSAVLEILEDHPKAIIFYNFNYELGILRCLCYPDGTAVAEWNSHNHQDIPKGSKWVYLVQYTAGAEGWNCTQTDTVIFFSQTYSYKTLEQAKGRIDRLNTPFTDLWYYHLRTRSGLDMGILEALNAKKTFNERRFVGK